MNRAETFELTLSRTIRASRDKVFDAFVTEAAMRQWMCPRGMTVAALELDARVGGGFRLTMRAKDGEQFTAVASYREIARRLNIGLDSIVFVDDSPVERRRVKRALPLDDEQELPRVGDECLRGELIGRRFAAEQAIEVRPRHRGDDQVELAHGIRLDTNYYYWPDTWVNRSPVTAMIWLVQWVT